LIYVDRNRLDSAGKPIRPEPAWFELAARHAEDARREGDRHQIREHVYRHASILVALEELFHRKCAYCETPLPEVGWDVDHFRPKGAVAERSEHPGYYWLAYTWSNLYPACEACNQRRRDRPTWTDREGGETGGKLTQFPLEDEAGRALSPEADLGLEQPVLLDPCADDPESRFLYTPHGEIEPAPADMRAEVTIDIFHLRRRRLRDRRKQHLNLVVFLIKWWLQIRGVNPKEAESFKADLDEKIFADSAPFAGAARSVLRDLDAFGI
jgi:uncharacterized protein (TIGR02646 family)